MASVELREDRSEGDQLAKDLELLTLEGDEADNSVQESVSMRDMHFTNGDWYPKEKPKPKRIQDEPDSRMSLLETHLSSFPLQ